jgi:uncharacterized protein (DUF1800 family)
MAIGRSQAGAVTAFNRFGFGARPGNLDAAAGDPRGFLLEELWTANVARIGDPAPPSGPKAFEAYYLDQQQQRAARIKAARAAPTCMATSPSPIPAIGPRCRSMIFFRPSGARFVQAALRQTTGGGGARGRDRLPRPLPF